MTDNITRRNTSAKTEIYIEELEEQLDTLESKYYDLEVKYYRNKIYTEDLIRMIIIAVVIWDILLVIYTLN